MRRRGKEGWKDVRGFAARRRRSNQSATAFAKPQKMFKPQQETPNVFLSGVGVLTFAGIFASRVCNVSRRLLQEWSARIYRIFSFFIILRPSFSHFGCVRTRSSGFQVYSTSADTSAGGRLWSLGRQEVFVFWHFLRCFVFLERAAPASHCRKSLLNWGLKIKIKYTHAHTNRGRCAHKVPPFSNERTRDCRNERQKRTQQVLKTRTSDKTSEKHLGHVFENRAATSPFHAFSLGSCTANSFHQQDFFNGFTSSFTSSDVAEYLRRTAFPFGKPPLWMLTYESQSIRCL